MSRWSVTVQRSQHDPMTLIVRACPLPMYSPLNYWAVKLWIGGLVNNGATPVLVSGNYGGQLLLFLNYFSFPSCLSLIFPSYFCNFPFLTYFSTISWFLTCFTFTSVSHLFLNYFSLISQLFLIYVFANYIYNLSHLPPDLLKLSSLKAFVMILEQQSTK